NHPIGHPAGAPKRLESHTGAGAAHGRRHAPWPRIRGTLPQRAYRTRAMGAAVAGLAGIAARAPGLCRPGRLLAVVVGGRPYWQAAWWGTVGRQSVGRRTVGRLPPGDGPQRLLAGRQHAVRAPGEI